MFIEMIYLENKNKLKIYLMYIVKVAHILVFSKSSIVVKRLQIINYVLISDSKFV